MPNTTTQKMSAALKPGWVVLVLGGSGYMLSETRLLGPILAIFLSAATIFQLNQYLQAKRARNNGG